MNMKLSLEFTIMHILIIYVL